MTSPNLFPPLPSAAHEWYAVRVRSHCERVAGSILQANGYEHLLPEVRSRRRWSDRTTQLQVPLFPGYVFCRFDAATRVPVLECAGVVGIVGFGSVLAPIPAE